MHTYQLNFTAIFILYFYCKKQTPAFQKLLLINVITKYRECTADLKQKYKDLQSASFDIMSICSQEIISVRLFMLCQCVFTLPKHCWDEVAFVTRQTRGGAVGYYEGW